MKKNKLKHLVIKELSLVNRPANQGSFSVLHKSDDMTDDTEVETPVGLFERLKKFLSRNDTEEELTLKSTHPDASSYLGALELSVASVLVDDSLTPNERAAAVRKASEDFCDALVGTVVSTEDHTELNKGDPDMPIETDVLKGLSEPARELITKAQADAKSAMDLVAKMQSDAKDAETLSVAKSIVGDTAIEPEKVAAVLKQLDAAGVETVKAVFTKANAVTKGAAKVLTAEIGGNADTITAINKADLAVAEVMKAEPKLTKFQAFAKALAADPKLYDELR